ncbi:MAG: hypothetical protein A3F78_21950 [Burkholderiales bacterium RIFCSPLOWO2_12_FULL_61_40]|nr:MAG: hypothetical protein A3F78_21950 [Burkholderiales bacterium RIFCSPLOWO2_12_FULL_61_40]
MKRNTNLFGAALCLLILGGCAASGSPQWDAQFGDRVRSLNAQQLITPQAPTHNAQATPATDGRSAREAMSRHVESYRSPPPTTVINVGSIGTSR